MTTVAPVEARIRRARLRVAGRRRTWGTARFVYDGTDATIIGMDGTVLESGVVAEIMPGGCGCGGRRGWNVTMDNGDTWSVQE